MDLPTDRCQLTEGIDKNRGVILYYPSHYLFMHAGSRSKKQQKTQQTTIKKPTTTQPQTLIKIIFHRTILPLTDVTALLPFQARVLFPVLQLSFQFRFCSHRCKYYMLQVCTGTGNLAFGSIHWYLEDPCSAQSETNLFCYWHSLEERHKRLKTIQSYKAQKAEKLLLTWKKCYQQK